MLTQKSVYLCGWNRVNSPKSHFLFFFKSNLSCGSDVFLLRLLQKVAGKASRLKKLRVKTLPASEGFVLRNHNLFSPQNVQYSAPSHPATFGQFAPFCFGMGSWKTLLKGSDSELDLETGKASLVPEKMQWCHVKYKATKKMKSSWGNGCTVKFKSCYRKFSTRKWRPLAQSSKICWECHLHIDRKSVV